MTASRKDTARHTARIQPLRLRRVLLAFTALLPQFLGCAAFHPIKGVPARQVPEEYLAEPRSGRKTIDLSLLRQAPPDQHYVDGGDVLAVYIEGVLGRREDVPPVHFPENGETRPSLGYPIPVRGDGTISVPMVPPISVRGMTISQVEVAIRRAYTIDRNILEQGRDRIFVALQRPREYRVLVIRQEEGNLSAGGQGLNLGSLKRGSGDVVRLPAYRNDVLNALAETNGLPGLDAENAIYVIRRRKTNHGQPAPSLQPGLPVLPGGPGAPPEQNHLPHDSGFPALQPPGPGYSAADSPNQIVQVSGVQAWPGSPADVNSNSDNVASDNLASDNLASDGPETHTAIAVWDHSPEYQQVAQVSRGAAPAGWGH
ncbi:MAG: polysaccharide biosynthesis/export family protein, partial [Planctomycetaceae bacterium]|nr:polysaccharide biosynthesis/export family protein [Planctomycetaceae bacterium]